MTKKKQEKTPDELRESILAAMMNHVPFDGWSQKSIESTAKDLSIEAGIIDLAFPGGVLDMIDLHAQQCDLEMLEKAKVVDFSKLKIREKITQLVKLRIEADFPYKEQVNRTVSFLALPGNHVHSVKMLYRTVDLMWKAISDQSTDFNFYTKRMTLGAVYSSTFLYWLGDESENAEETWEFLDRRIENVMQFEKAKASCKNKDFKLPNIWRELGKKRYGN